MAQAKPVDQQEHEEYLEQRYGYSRIPKRSGSKLEPDTVPTANTNQAPSSRARRVERKFRKSQNRLANQPTTENIKPSRVANTNAKPQRIRRKRKSKVGKALHPTSLIKRSIVWAINLWFFFWQIFLGAFFLVTLGLGAIVADGILTSFISDIIEWFSGIDIENIFMLFYFLLWAMGWLNLLTVWIFFAVTQTHSLSGSFADTKMTRFMFALVFYACPFLNIVPWVFLWSGFALRNPK